MEQAAKTNSIGKTPLIFYESCTCIKKIHCYIAVNFFPTAHALIGYFEVT